MGFLSWLFGKENDPPEPLVLGAKLRCPYGDQDSYLMVFSDDIDINNLPKATVDDCRPIINILPFGNCYAEGICESEMSFTDQWINPEPQSEKVNGKEVITTKSILVCSKSGMNLKIINSGQDGIVAGQIKFILDMDKKYKGLREILDDPYGSLYLNEGKYRQAIRFLEELVKKNDGEIPLSIMYDKDNIEGSYIKSTLSHLLPSCNLQDFAQYISGMETIAVKNSVDSETLDVRILNAELIELIKTDCQDTDDKIKNGGFYRWNEEHKLFLSVLADGAMNLAYVALLYSSMVNSQRISAEKEVKSKVPKADTNGTSNDLSGLKGKIVKTSSAEEVNNWWKTEMGYDNPPYKPGTTVSEIQLSEETIFVRVYDGKVSKQYGGWVLRAEDIEGLTPLQIQDKFSLPATPKYMTDVKLPAGTTIRKGIVNPLAGWGKGGGVQFDLMGQRIGEFTNERILP